MKTRFFLDQDDSCHWYLIPENKRKKWESFCKIPATDERSWQVPDWATELDSSIQYLTFTDPREQ